MGTQVIFWFVFLATLLLPYCLLAKLQYFTLKDRYLPGHIYRSISTVDWSECLHACAISENCVSYSFEKRKGSENCHLHACGFQNECAAVERLIASQDSVFQQLRSTKDINENQTRRKLCFKSSKPIPEVAITMHNLQEVDLCSRKINQTLIQGAGDMFTTTICGNKKTLLADCKNKRMHLESLKYVRCNCSCEDCNEMGVICSTSSLFLRLERKCEGRERCRVQITNKCDGDILRSLRVSYRCI